MRLGWDVLVGWQECLARHLEITWLAGSEAGGGLGSCEIGARPPQRIPELLEFRHRRSTQIGIRTGEV